MKEKIIKNFKRPFCWMLALSMVFNTTVRNSYEVLAVGDGNTCNTSKYQPLSISDASYNADIVYSNGEAFSTIDCYNRTYTADKSTTYNANANFFFDSTIGTTGNLPDNHIIQQQSGYNNITGDTGLYWNVRAYDNNVKNAVKVLYGSNNARTIKFDTIGVYKKIYLLTVCGGVNGNTNTTLNVTVKYSDGTSETRSFVAYDAYTSVMTGIATGAYKKYVRSGSGSVSFDGEVDGAPYLIRSEMNVDTSKLIDNIVVSNTGNSNMTLCIMGITGEVEDIPAPSSVTLKANSDDSSIDCRSISAEWAVVENANSYRIDVATDEKFTHIVSGYNNKVVDTNSCLISGLNSNTKYYVRVRSVLSDGGQSASSDIVACEITDHTFTYSVDTEQNNKLNATCSCCGSTVSLSLAANSPVYSSTAEYSATLSATSTWTAAGLTSPVIKYYKADAEGSTSGTEQVTSLSGLAGGNYYVSITAGETTLKVPFKIVVPATGVDLNKTSIDLLKDTTETLTATVSPDNATIKTVSWTSSNESIATVTTDGVVTAVSSGVATITAACGEVSATCTVIVYSNTYTLTVPATAEAVGSGYNAVGDVNVKGDIANTKKIVVTATGSNSNKFRSTTASTEIGYSIVTGDAVSNTVVQESGLNFSCAEIGGENGKTVSVGLLVDDDDYRNADDGDYTTTITWIASLSSVN